MASGSCDDVYFSPAFFRAICVKKGEGDSELTLRRFRLVYSAIKILDVSWE